MSTSTLPPQRKRDRLQDLQPRRSRPVSLCPPATGVHSNPLNTPQQTNAVASTFNSALVPLPTSSASALRQPSGVLTVSQTATTPSHPQNPASTEAIRRHLEKLTEAEKKRS
ncbi:hypothetical protein AUEXF2481DRAFT_25784 [Aureobasidium subglaciale EXF-2481]|uniref:Uncharacterized protein n=1 Tax=Aureobasidium subglaciale (strain EXF-2481) TaxID=1043005 RepID=A0A074YQE6_AURSE|nr:uncharacterized protein AUEXF2481DRAFT_25784 [Aureobasidium subglaciale EXF-2481]KEQ99910.1 hypothetical protein AUEXF2481DRAFT_25784 [Aureobasidium subglaciale EXF-2481]